MLTKNKIDKKLRGYIKEHLRKGYTKHAVKKVLVNHGYDENYVDGLIKRHQETVLVKNVAIISVLFLFVFFSFNIISTNNILKNQQNQKITGYLIGQSTVDEGCCLAVCQQTSKQECYGKFAQGKSCNLLEECIVGCCIDKEGYCLTNYLYGNCVDIQGSFIRKECNEIVYCRNLTDLSYASRLYKIRQAGGFADVNPIADYYGSTFTIKFYIYDKTGVVSIVANIKDSNKLIETIALYDDGSHNDGVSNDNLYANNWLSSKLNQFQGFKELNVDIIITYSDGTQQSLLNAKSFVVLNNNKCLPIAYNGNPSDTTGIIFAANNYPQNNGYQIFETDVNNFNNLLFSTTPFANNKNNLNVYRLEEALYYPNTATLLAVVSNSCPSYSNKRDMVIWIDANEPYCIKESLNVVRVNPQVILQQNISTATISEVFANFCGYVLTPQMIVDQMFGSLKPLIPPAIVVYTLDNTTYTTPIVSLLYTVSAVNYPVNNSVFLDGTLIYNKILSYTSTETMSLNLVNGTNVVWITATDSNKNNAFAQLLLNATI